jgi:hypothetical protein
MVKRRAVLWGAVFTLLIALAVPWFLWRTDAVVAGLPVWLWWHIGWMALTALTFHAFARRAWGLGVEEVA